MANNSVVTQEVLQDTIERYHENFVYPYLNGATHAGFTPVGTVISYFGETAPEYFLVCDGTEYAKSDYPQLADLLLNLTDPTPFEGSDANHFAVPDLRGEFLRGTGTNSHTNQGNGANVGVHQDATELMLPAINLTTGATYISAQNDNMGYDKADASFNKSNLKLGSFSTTPQSSSTGTWTVTTSRPTNASVLYCIAYKDIYIDLALDSFPLGISNPTDGQLLMYDATAGRWVNAEIDTKHTYSTDEHVVGTWIDGKPIYEKTIVTTMPTITTDTLIAERLVNITDANIEKYIFGFGRIKDQMNIERTWSSGNTVYYSLFSYLNNDNFVIQCNRISLSELPVILTIQYTKTTDTV